VAFNFASAPVRPPRERALGPCHVSGCRKPRLKGETTCFDHLDLEELERAIAEPEDEELADRVHRLELVAQLPAPIEEVAPVAAQEEKEMAKKDEAFTCRQGCGRELTSAGRRAQHEVKCKGKVATSGRIAAAAVSDAKPAVSRKPTRIASKKRARPVSRPQVRGQNRNRAHRTPPDGLSESGDFTTAKDVLLVKLRERRQEIDSAIAAIEAIG
jgi:hypothetical protein